MNKEQDYPYKEQDYPLEKLIAKIEIAEFELIIEIEKMIILTRQATLKEVGEWLISKCDISGNTMAMVKRFEKYSEALKRGEMP